MASFSRSHRLINRGVVCALAILAVIAMFCYLSIADFVAREAEVDFSNRS